MRLLQPVPAPTRPRLARRSVQPHREGWGTPYVLETAAWLDSLLTRQAVKTLIYYATETNGELHLFLNEWLVQHPLVVDAKGSHRAWLAELGSQPLTKVLDPGRSSSPSAAALEQVLKGEREVSPRDVLERILALRIDLAEEASVSLARTSIINGEVLRATLARTLQPKPPSA